jgi:hypothetical protein
MNAAMTQTHPRHLAQPGARRRGAGKQREQLAGHEPIPRNHCRPGFARPPTRPRQPRIHIPGGARCRPSVLGRRGKRR